MSLGCAREKHAHSSWSFRVRRTSWTEANRSCCEREEFDVGAHHPHEQSRESVSRSRKRGSATRSAVGKATRFVVETGSVGAEYSRPGVPLGPSASFVERFTLSADGSRLHYTIVMTDPYSLTQPVEQKRSWIAVDERGDALQLHAVGD